MIDPDVIAMRKILAAYARGASKVRSPGDYLGGHQDLTPSFQRALLEFKAQMKRDAP